MKTVVLARERSVQACIDTNLYEIAPGGLTVNLRWTDAGPAERIEVTESADRVVIGVIQRVGFEPGFGEQGATGEVKLKAPLGARAVYDAHDGSRMLQSGPSPGGPPCPEPPPQMTPLESAIAEREQYGMNTDSERVARVHAHDRA